MPNDKVYLGDAVYVEHGPFWGAVILTTENGLEATNTIVLEPEVLANLVRVVGAWTRKGDSDAS